LKNGATEVNSHTYERVNAAVIIAGEHAASARPVIFVLPDTLYVLIL